MIRWLVALVLMLAALAQPAAAHEVRPAYLSATETEAGTWDIVWKQPVLSGKRLKIAPEFAAADGDALAPCAWEAEERENLAAATIERGTLNCAIASVTIDGLDRTLTDVIVDVRPLEAEPVTALLRANDLTLDLREPAGSPAGAYLTIGVEHIVFGWDHLLFVIGLVLLIDNWRRLVLVATAFTLAHSLTLGLAALGVVGVPSRPVEILIAASIVLLGWEILRKQRGQEGLVIQRPYLVAIVVGLVHGLGFAGALSNIGLPAGTELLALLMFNLGVELGQIAVIALVLLAMWAMARARAELVPTTQRVVAYAIGAIGMFWMIERLGGYWV